MSPRPVTALAAATLLAGSLAACGDEAKKDETATLTVFAASSLKTVFEQLGETFEADHPGVRLSFSFAGSSDLVAQIQQGAPADVFAAADTTTMTKLGAALAMGNRPFASNTLEIAVPPGNPARVATLADLVKEDVQLVTCAPEVPCGAAAATVEANAKLDWKPVSEEQSVVDVLGKVESGEADAGLVYVTDVRAAGDKVESIAIPARVNAVNTYRIVALGGSEQQVDLAGEWIDLVRGATGRQALADAGFGAA